LLATILNFFFAAASDGSDAGKAGTEKTRKMPLVTAYKKLTVLRNRLTS